MKADSGASKTYLQPKHAIYLTSQKVMKNGPRATLPDGSQIQAVAGGQLDLSKNLSTPALIYPQLTSESLLSIGQLCDHGCIAIFTKTLLLIFKNGKLTLSGKRNLRDGLWDVPFEQNKIDLLRMSK